VPFTPVLPLVSRSTTTFFITVSSIFARLAVGLTTASFIAILTQPAFGSLRSPLFVVHLIGISQLISTFRLLVWESLHRFCPCNLINTFLPLSSNIICLFL